MNKRYIARLITVLVVLALFSITKPAVSQSPTPPALEQLTQAASGALEITWNPLTGTPSFIRGHIPLSTIGIDSPTKSSTAAITLVDRYASLFGVRQASSELKVIQDGTDALGMRHFTLQQVYRGVDVYGGSIKVHLSTDGQEIVAVSSNFVPGVQVQDTQPHITADQALAAARKALPNGILLSSPRLVIYPGWDEKSKASAKLAWLIELRDDALPARNTYVIDAVDGSMLDVLDHLYKWSDGRQMQSNIAQITAVPSNQATLQCDPQVYYGVQHCADDNGDTHIIIADLNDPHVRIQTVLPSGPDGECNSVNHSGKDQLSNCPPPYPFETVESMLKRYWTNGAVAIVNADYFGQDGDHGAEGLAVRNGQRLDGTEHNDKDGNATTRTSLAFSPSNEAIIGKPENESQIDTYRAYHNVVAGGPTIVRVGQAMDNNVCNEDNLTRAHCTRYAQSAAGLTNDGRLILITAKKDAAGIANYLVTHFHVDSALKFDGGGSARLAWLDDNGQIQAYGATREDRPVAEGLLVFSTNISGDADDGRRIASGETLEGTIEPADDVDTYYFFAIQGQQVTIRMTKSNSTFSLDPYLILYAPDGSEITRDDDGGDNHNALINQVSLPQNGRYHIEAKSYAGRSTGLYTLSLTLHRPGQVNRETYDAHHSYTLPGTLARSEGQGATGDQDVDNAHDFAGATYDYYWNTHGRDSYDNQGATIVSTANYGRSYMNAYWNGEQIVYGDGFPVNDVVAHEWTHAVTEHSAALEYRWQSGALNESFSDIFGAMVDRNDWLMGEDLPPNVLGGRDAIRDLSDPPRLGQPAHTDDWLETCSDNEGVHTNSGITNKAYYNIATAIGKDKAEHIFYRALTVYLDTNSSLEDARAAVLQSAQDLYGANSPEYNAVRDGFNAVGLDGQWNPPPNDCTCAATLALSDETVYPDPISALDVATTLYRVRDELLTGTEAGEHYRLLYEEYTGRIAWLLLLNSELRVTMGQILKAVTPGLNHLMDGQGDQDVITQELIDDVRSFLRHLAEEDRARGGGELADTIKREGARIDWNHLIGMTFEEAWQYIQSRVTVHSPVIYLPTILK